jgi:hypothetical protein
MISAHMPLVRSQSPQSITFPSPPKLYLPCLNSKLPLTNPNEPAVFTLGPEKTTSKIYLVVGPKTRFADFPAIFTAVRSQLAVFDPITLDEWGATVARTVGKGYEEDIRQMMEWIAVAPDEKICYGTMDTTEDASWDDLGVRASTFEEWLARARWDGP